MCTVGQLLVRAPLAGSSSAGTFLGVAGAWEDSRHAQILTSRHDSSGGGRAEHHDAAQGHGAGKAPTTKAPSVGTSAPKAAAIDSRIIEQQGRRHRPRRHDEDKRLGRTARRRSRRPRRPRLPRVRPSGTGTTRGTGTTTTPAHVRAQRDLHEDLEEPQPARQSQGDAADRG